MRQTTPSSRIFELGFIVLTHEMQNVKCKIRKTYTFQSGNEPSGAQRCNEYRKRSLRIVSGHCPLN